MTRRAATGFKEWESVVSRAEVTSELPAIALIAASAGDAERLGELLARFGRSVDTFDSPADFDRQEPRTDAVIVCHRAAASAAPVPRLPSRLRGLRVVVVSDRDDEPHVVEVLSSGAHHLFQFGDGDAVLGARLEASLRRHAAVRDAALSISPFRFDLARHRALLGAEALDLSPREFDFAYYMFAHRGRLVTNAELLTSVWSLPQGIDTRRIDTAACRVRKKMRLDDRTGWVLRRFRREGYGLYGDTRSADRGATGPEEPGGSQRRERGPDE